MSFWSNPVPQPCFRAHRIPLHLRDWVTASMLGPWWYASSGTMVKQIHSGARLGLTPRKTGGKMKRVKVKPDVESEKAKLEVESENNNPVGFPTCYFSGCLYHVLRWYQSQRSLYCSMNTEGKGLRKTREQDEQKDEKKRGKGIGFIWVGSEKLKSLPKRHKKTTHLLSHKQHRVNLRTEFSHWTVMLANQKRSLFFALLLNEIIRTMSDITGGQRNEGDG
ncbi:hypothetical protein C8J56DRAFT_1029026 [Mycena floridula]|nr:hypothetical protein C8J56DRAFT_1029026 [Mycena floridula]